MPDTHYVLVSKVSGDKGIFCRRCGRVSWNPNDVQHKYCGACQIFHAVNTRLPFGSKNLWLAEMGYMTLVRVLRQIYPDSVAFPLEPTLEQLPLDVQDAFIAAAAAIRRRVVNWQLSAAEEEP